MIDKTRLLDSWIMVEQFSEGEFKSSKEFKPLIDIKENYYQNLYEFLQLKVNRKYNNRGLVIYFNIFPFSDVVEELRKRFHIEMEYEDMKIGEKFGFALYFDKVLQLNENKTFYTFSYYLHQNREIISEPEFKEFERNFKKDIAQIFEMEELTESSFNRAFDKLIKKYDVSFKNSKYKLSKNSESDDLNMHSFFVNDLELAKTIQTKNLTAYLQLEKPNRVNLDSKRESSEFNPQAFIDILQPKNYPLGRFPSNTEYALSFMQQVAVNLSCGVDSQDIRSVNGPPGTGKTTLLKDVFADIMVKQMKAVVDCKEKDFKTIKVGDLKIAKLPPSIADGGIVVASSNNGAVQNIVNELPLSSKVDSDLLDDLLNADYFTEVCNELLQSEDENEKDRFWGLVSIQGGKSDNISTLLEALGKMIDFLEKDDFSYAPTADLFFEDYYRKVERYKNFVQNVAEGKRINGTIFVDVINDELKVYQNLRDTKLENAQKYRKIIDEEKNDHSQILNKIANVSSQIKQLEINVKQLEDVQFKSKLFSMFGGNRKQKLIEAQKVLNTKKAELKELQSIENQLSFQYSYDNSNYKSMLDSINKIENEKQEKIKALEETILNMADSIKKNRLDMNIDYEALQLSNPWFEREYRIMQSKLFIYSLEVRKQFLCDNLEHLRTAIEIWNQQDEYKDKKEAIIAAWQWINFAIPIISSTFASFGRMFRNLPENSLGHLFIDEAGQATPQASVGAIYRSKHVMAVGDPSQIKPVVTLPNAVLRLVSEKNNVPLHLLSDVASTQTLVAATSQYGFYKQGSKKADSWIGIPLWVHRRCRYPMFTISNHISYNNMMVQANKKDGKAAWYNVAGKATEKFVEEQAKYLSKKIEELIEKDPTLADEIYVITPFRNVAEKLTARLSKIGFTKKQNNKATNIGTVHTFQGKEAKIVFLVLGADGESTGAARWAVDEANMMNVAATRATEEFYVIGDQKLYLSLKCPVATDTLKIIKGYNHEGDVEIEDKKVGVVSYKGKKYGSSYAYIIDEDGVEYAITSKYFNEHPKLINEIKKGVTIRFTPGEKGEYKNIPAEGVEILNDK